MIRFHLPAPCRIAAVTIAAIVLFASEGQASAKAAAPSIAEAVRTARLAYLKAHAVRVATVDPANVDFADLEPLRQAIGPKRIVMLGETTHGEGPTFSAKVRLVKFLHERMGFDVLAFESGLYDMRRAEADIRAGRDHQEALSSALFVDWSASHQMRPLWAYLDAQRETGHPLDVSGFDLQFTGSASTDHLLTDLDAFLARCRLDPAAAAAADRVKSVLALVLKDPGYIARGSGFQSAKPEDRSAALTAARVLGESLAALSFSGEPERFERDFWIQLIASCASFLEMSWGIDPLAMDAAARDRAINIRDRQMAENLLWLANRAHPGRKIIVWTATGHVLHRRFSLAGAPGPTVPMGEWIDRALGSEVYSVGFAAYEGWWGTVEMRAPEEVPPAAPNSLEELLSSAGFSFAFLDLRAVDAEGVWLRESLLCRALRYVPVAADWTRLLDGIFFIRETSPSLRSDPLRLRE